MSKRIVAIAFIISTIGIVSYAIPFLEVSAFGNYSLWDFMTGTLSGGEWSVARITLLTIFSTLLITSSLMAFKLYKLRNNPVHR